MEEANNVDKEMADRLIAKSFTFEVVSHAGEEIKEVPLKDIWAYDMPGTKDVRQLEPDAFGKTVAELSSRDRVRRANESLLSNLLRPLADVPKREAAQGFNAKSKLFYLSPWSDNWGPLQPLEVAQC